MKTLGEVIRDGRKEKGLNTQEASERLKMSRMTLLRLEENQTRLISVDHILDIANFLEVDFFKMIQANGKKIISIQLLNLFKVVRRIYFEDTLIDTKKLEILIKNNLDDIKMTN